MYGSRGGPTSSFSLARMNAVECHIEFPRHVPERGRQRRGTSNEDVIVTGAQTSRVSALDQFAQAAPDPVAHHGIADLPRHSEAHPH